MATSETKNPINSMAVLYAKLARITQKMKRIRKTGRHPSQGYQFATDTDITEAVSEAMADENLAIIPSIISYQVLDGGKTRNDQPIYHTICEFEFTFVCGDTGESMTRKWFNESLDSSDKGFNKTATAAMKYFLMKTFLITTGEPDEHEMSEVDAKQSKSNEKGGTRNATSKKGNGGQNGSNGASGAISDAWDENAVKTFVDHYADKMVMSELLATLKVQRFGEWKQGGIAAYKVVDGQLALREMEF